MNKILSKLYCGWRCCDEIPREIVTPRLIEEPYREEGVRDGGSDPRGSRGEVDLEILIVPERVSRDDIEDFLRDHERDRIDALRQALEELGIIREEDRGDAINLPGVSQMVGEYAVRF
nr:hypothetical protein [Methanoculleus sp.]